ncbi:hypothetical protein KJ891_05215 [Candidatus Micrarchaeota archaeon]|nr:hypothetical protein [Candidatus Micrarchaeota archaeon]
MVSSKAFAVPLLFVMLLPALPFLQVSENAVHDIAIPQVSQGDGDAVPAVIIPPVVPLPNGGVLFPVPDGNGWLYPVPKIPPLKPVPDLFICRDSDGGKNYFAAGITTGFDPANRGYAGTTDFNDFCADSNTLTEYFCVADWAHSERVSCDYGCELGACSSGPGPDTNYCCPAGEDCVIARDCEADGTIECTMREGQNMEIRNFRSACDIKLGVENNGAMGWLQLKNNKIPPTEKLYIQTGNIETYGSYEESDGGVSINDSENVALTAGNVVTHGWGVVSVYITNTNRTIRLFAGDIVATGENSSTVAIGANNSFVEMQNITATAKNSTGVSLSGSSASNNELHLGNITADYIGLIVAASDNDIFAGNITSSDEGIEFYGNAVEGLAANRNGVSAGNIYAPSGILFYAANENSLAVGDLNSTNKGIFYTDGSKDNSVLVGNITSSGVGISTGAISSDNLVCAKAVSAGASKCKVGGNSTLTGCENGTPIPNCSNSKRDCSECPGGANCALDGAN